MRGRGGGRISAQAFTLILVSLGDITHDMKIFKDQ